MNLILGFTERVNECDCCGKTDLKGTYPVIIEGQDFYYGSTCVKRNLNLPNDKALNKVISETKELLQINARVEFELEGGKKMEAEICNIDFSLPEWDTLNEKIQSLRKRLCKKYKITHF